MKYIAFVIIVVLSFFAIRQYNEINNLHSRINSLNSKLEKINVCDPDIIKELSNQQYKEDYYLTQLSNSSNLILSVIGFALIIAGISSYVLIEERFKLFRADSETSLSMLRSHVDVSLKTSESSINAFESKMNANASKYEGKYKELENNILSVKNDLHFEASRLKQNEAKEALSIGYLEGYIYFSLHSATYSVSCAKFYSKSSPKLSESILESINIQLNSTYKNVVSFLDSKSLSKATLRADNKDQIIKFINDININNLNINKLKKEETFELLNKIYSLLDFD